jgi:hypothetical protein
MLKKQCGSLEATVRFITQLNVWKSSSHHIHLHRRCSDHVYHEIYAYLSQKTKEPTMSKAEKA